MLTLEKGVSMGHNLNATLPVALIERWNRQQQLRFPGLSEIDLYHYGSSKRHVLIRPMKDDEKAALVGGNRYTGQQVYGVFPVLGDDWLACGSDALLLATQAQEQLLIVAWLQ
jgi:hypothetical protein